MSDWRDGGDSKKKKPAKQPRQTKPAKSSESRPKSDGGGGWRSKSAGAVGAGSGGGQTGGAGDRSWKTRTADDPGLSTGMLGRWAAIAILFAASAGLIGYFVWFVFNRPPKLPVFVLSVGEHESARVVENPYGNAEREALQRVNTQNIRYLLKARDNDNLLASLRNSNWVPNDPEFTKGLQGGGPNRKLVTFYVNAMADERADGLWLVPQTAHLTGAQANDATELIGISDFFKNIAGALKGSAIAWVVLDLHAPPTVSVLQDRNWKTLVGKAYDALPDATQKRLVITLACDDGQENWLAPELNSTFFGYFFKRGLSGGFLDELKWTEASSLQDLKNALDRQVLSSVATWRYAEQTPCWWIHPSIDSSMQVVSAHSSDLLRAEPVTGLEQHWTDIDELWLKLETKYANAWKWDPSGVAIAESKLQFLEQMAVFAGGRFDAVLNETRSALDVIQMPDLPPFASLVEQRIHEQSLLSEEMWTQDHENVEKILKEERWPSFWPFHIPPAPGVPAPIWPDSRLNEKDRPAFVWQWLVERALSQDTEAKDIEERRKVFGEKSLAASLAFAGRNGSWVEMHMLKLLVQEVEWGQDSQDGAREEACALAIATFDRLQSVALRSIPETSWWVGDEIGKVEQQFLHAFDLLLVAEFASSQQEFRVARSSIDRLLNDIVQFERSVIARNEAIRCLPHLLTWSIREYQFAEDRRVKDIKTRLVRLAETVQLVDELGVRLDVEPRWPAEALILTRGLEINDQLQRLLQEWQGFVDKQVNEGEGAKSNPETYRNILLALQSPLTRVSDRRKLHEIAGLFLKAGAADQRLGGSSEKQPPNRALAEARKVFVDAIRTAGDKDFWNSMLDGKMRDTIDLELVKLSGSIEPVSFASLGELRSKLSTLDRACRWRAPALADAWAIQREVNLKAWPWSASWQRWRLDSGYYRQLQSTRFARSAWGDGNLANVTSGENLLFWKLAVLYQPEVMLSGAGPLDGLVSDFRDQWLKSLDTTERWLREIKVQIGKSPDEIDGSQVTHRTNAVVNSAPVPVVAEVSLVWQNNRLPFRKDDGSETVVLPVELGESPSEIRNVSVGLQPWKDPQGRLPDARLALRGHWRENPVEWNMTDKERVQFTLTLSSPKPDHALINVLPPKKPPRINVVLLLDCSNSMDILVDKPAEERERDSGSDEKIPLFDLVKSQAQRLLEGLDRVQIDKQAEVYFSLIPFGLANVDGVQQKFDSLDPYIFRTEMDPLTPQLKSAMLKCIDQLETGGNTPLYDSIRHASETLRDLPGSIGLIYVLSDGVNDTLGFPELNTTAETARNSLGKSRLSAFHFDYFDIWNESQKPIDEKFYLSKEYNDGKYQSYFKEKPEELEKLINKTFNERKSFKDKGVEELMGMNRSDGQFIYHRYEPLQHNALVEDLEASIPKLSVLVESDTGYRSEDPKLREFKIGAEFLPCNVTVSTESQLFGHTERTVRIVGGELLKLRFDPNGPRFEFPRFSEENTDFRPLGNSDGIEHARANSRPYLLEDQDQNGFYQYSFGFGETTRENEVFVQRPEFLLAEVTESDRGREKGKVIFLADRSFVPNRHFPIAQTSKLKLNGRLERLRVWYAAVMPDCVAHIDTAGDKAALDQAALDALRTLGVDDKVKLEITRSGRQLVCIVNCDSATLAAEDRPILLCPSAVSADRKFDLTNRQESHVFSLPDGLEPEQAGVLIVTTRKLDDALDANLMRYDSANK